MKKWLASFFVLFLAGTALAGTNTEILYLSGRGSDAPVNWQFKVSAGRRAGQWSTIPVPSNWELQGFGNYNYGHDKNPASETGFYVHTFVLPQTWKNKRIFIVFEGSMTDTEVKINGKLAGPVHQGGFYRFKYDITRLVTFDAPNRLNVRVSKISADSTVTLAERRADYWVFGGIYRPVYLQAVPQQYIDWTAIDARADGSFKINVTLGGQGKANRIQAQIRDLHGRPLGTAFFAPLQAGQSKVTLKTRVTGQKNWTAETPVLYTVDVTLLHNKKIIHSVRQRFGFRTFEVVDGKGLFLNGKRVILKGCDRHSFWPTTGRALSREKCRNDILTIKSMNMNAVRMSHYPPDSYFLDLCDELGLYVLDELGGWHRPPYDTPVGKKLVAEMVKRDVNHPSILFWDNGNEGGWNTALDAEFSLYDPQNRRVLHPGAVFNGLDDRHYPTYAQIQKRLQGESILMPTEILHGLYDGGSGSGLDDYWHALWNAPRFGGMFFWVFADEGVVRTDRHCTIDTDGNHAPDGILGPFHEKEASFFTIKEIWSPVYIETDSTLPPNFSGEIPVENRYDFTNLKHCHFAWKLVRFPNPAAANAGPQVLWQGRFSGPDLPPHSKGFLRIPLPEAWPLADGLFLTAFDPQNHPLFTWRWKWTRSSTLRRRFFVQSNETPALTKNRDVWRVTAGPFTFFFDRHSGLLKKVQAGPHEIPVGNGPVFTSSAFDTLKPPENKIKITARKLPGVLQLTVLKDFPFDTLRWEIFGSGWLKLHYTFSSRDTMRYLGVSFTYPEDKLNEMTWLGKGPYRVWENRLKGPTISVWHNDYKHFQDGTRWDYPEFAGYYADFNWALFKTATGPFVVATDNDSLFFRVSREKDGVGARHTAMVWPTGTLSFLHAIPAMGSKFHTPEDFGPESQPFAANGQYSGTLYFYFGMP